eukprot:CAMPEP_0178395232 /NCGR_PEP_ID=MMETSP0689_2-20121128/13113_1 /TAXON_ID=160604 /ORGANISM="Amphidinium massartii, Strain CS-259" /LENGTH=242 /DNA_ID=CAMNT_0020015881 /DNA_START=65 /DNA_END=793 /DNA_ORIENTATION=+
MAFAYTYSIWSGDVTWRDYTLSKAMDFGIPHHVGCFLIFMNAACLAWLVVVRFLIVHNTVIKSVSPSSAALLQYVNLGALPCGLVSAWAMGGVGVWNVDFQRQVHGAVTVVSIFSTQFYFGGQLFIDQRLFSLGVFGSPSPPLGMRIWHYIRIVLWLLLAVGEVGNLWASIAEIPIHPQSHTWSSGFEVLMLFATFAFYGTLVVGSNTGYSGELRISSIASTPENRPLCGHDLEMQQQGDGL